MMKNKTNKSASKRFKISKNGKVMHRSHYIRHLRSSKSKSQIRSLKKMKQVAGVMGKKIKQMLGKA
ncbi:50S ribosomal protein L35 [Candidatus Roizmanbacteria bacterium]|nr:50S ribosomal protein L35 [Candidatus Roizmanbacteria bacterium]